MASPLQFVPLRDHLADSVDLYNHYVAHTTITFQVETMTAEEFAQAFSVYSSANNAAAFAVMEGPETLIGFCTLTPFASRGAFGQTSEIALYLHPNYTGKGYGAQVLDHLIGVAKERKLHTLIAAICGENQRSQELFCTLGWDKVGDMKQTGFKFDRYLDVVYYQLML